MAIRVNDDGAPNRVTYYFTDLTGSILAELPLTGVTFSKVLNASGPFAGTLNVEDPRVARLDWRAATRPNLTQIWVDINGTLVYGGIINVRRYTKKAGTVQVGASDHWTYLAQRLQAKDYATTWATSPAGAAQIAHQIISDALAVAGSLPLTVATPEATPAPYQITASYPRSQLQSVASMMTMLQQMGYLYGFDVAADATWSAGIPTASIDIAYPRRGRIAGTTGLVLDLGGQNVDLEWDEDGTSQGTTAYEMGAGSGGVNVSATWAAATSVDGYSLLEIVASNASITSTDETAAFLQGLANDALALSAYPAVTAAVTMPLYAEPAIGEWIVGDDTRVVLDPASALPADPRFPDGLDFYLRIVRSDVMIADQGLSTVKHTLNMPPSSTPIRPPQ